MDDAALIGLDWGTSSLRAYLYGPDGRVLARAHGELGVQAVRDGRFREAFEALCAPWLAARPAVPAIACGMVGSRQGWREAPYVECPAGFDELAAGLLRIDALAGRPFAIVPGVRSARGAALPDVMRGEETQVFGAIDAGDATLVLPGTHSKWVRVSGRRIVAFRTYLTGELYAVLSAHSILGRLFPETGPHRWAEHAFAQGLDLARDEPAGLTGLLFSARAEGLLGGLPADALPSYLSGLLIGAELAHACPGAGAAEHGPVTIVGAPELARRYAFALARLGVPATVAAGEPAAAGLQAIALAGGFARTGG
jgi:2-dehydro-3-deoxygalactonokinase